MTYNYYGGAGISDTAIHKSAGSGVKLIQGKQINRRSEAEIRRWLNEVFYELRKGKASYEIYKAW